MIDGDKGPMSILESISDEPCEPLAYIDYLIANHRNHAEHWRTSPLGNGCNERGRESVVFHIEAHIFDLENLRRKLSLRGVVPSKISA